MIDSNNNISFDCNVCVFKQFICQHITTDEFDLLYNTSQRLKFRKNEYIMKQGSKASYLAFISKGRVKMNFETDTGKNIILTITNSPNLLGAGIILNEGVNIFSIIAIEECEVCMIDIEVLKSFILKNGQLALKLLEFMSGMFKDSIFNFISLAHKHVNGRIADVLIYLSKTIYQNDKFQLTLTRKELADFAGCSQENVIHTFTSFHKEDIIKSEGKSLEILDANKLNNISRNG
jgi:CRP-like cAMP-binding protein